MGRVRGRGIVQAGNCGQPRGRRGAMVEIGSTALAGEKGVVGRDSTAG